MLRCHRFWLRRTSGVLVGAAAAGDAAEEAEQLVLELRGELGHGGLTGGELTAVEEGARCELRLMSSPEILAVVR